MYHNKNHGTNHTELIAHGKDVKLFRRANFDYVLADEAQGEYHLLASKTYSLGLSLLQVWPTDSLRVSIRNGRVQQFSLDFNNRFIAMFSDVGDAEIEAPQNTIIVATPSQLLVRENSRSNWEAILWYQTQTIQK